MRFYRTVSLFFFAILCLGCQPETDIYDIYEISDEAPVISVKKIEQRNIAKEYEWHKRLEKIIEVKFQLVADPAPKSDLLVYLKVPASGYYYSDYGFKAAEGRGFSGWTIIPTGETSSKVFTQNISVNSHRYVVVEPIPIISVVGTDNIVDTDKLSEDWGRRTLEDQLIPEGFRFPYYNVAEEFTTLYRPQGVANIINVDRPNGSDLDRFYVTVTFDAPPEFLKVNDKLLIHKNGDGTVFSVQIPLDPRPFLYEFKLSWGDETLGTAGEQDFYYTMGVK